MNKLLKNLPRPSTNMIMTIAAIIISLCALFVSFAEVRIMRSQQRATLYPYLTLSQQYNETGFGLILMNKGIGPARINSFQVNDGDLYFQDWVELVRHYLPDSLKNEMGWQNMKMNNIQHSIIAPNEQISLVFTQWTPISRSLVDPLKNLRLRLCYSSLLEEHWIINDFEPPAESNTICENEAEKEMN